MRRSRSVDGSHPRLLPDLGGVDRSVPAVAGKPVGLATRRIGSVKRSAEIAVIFDGVIDPIISGQAGGALSWNSTLCAFWLDNGGLGARTYLTDDYALSPVLNASQSISMAPNTPDPTFLTYNTDSNKNAGNIRFRHNKNNAANALMLDGHVQTFNYNVRNRQTDMTRRNIFVNR